MRGQPLGYRTLAIEARGSDTKKVFRRTRLTSPRPAESCERRSSVGHPMRAGRTASPRHASRWRRARGVGGRTTGSPPSDADPWPRIRIEGNGAVRSSDRVTRPWRSPTILSSSAPRAAQPPRSPIGPVSARCIGGRSRSSSTASAPPNHQAPGVIRQGPFQPPPPRALVAALAGGVAAIGAPLPSGSYVKMTSRAERRRGSSPHGPPP